MRRLIPPKTRNRATLYRGITYIDVLVFLIFLVLSALAISTNLGFFKLVLSLGLLAIGFGLCLNWGKDLKGYDWIIIAWKYINKKRKYSKKEVKEFLDFKIENNVIDLYGTLAGVVEVTPIEFLLYKHSKQMQVINQFANTLRYVRCGSIVKIEKPIDYAKYIERYERFITELEQEKETLLNLENKESKETEIDEATAKELKSIEARIEILKKNVDFLKHVNTEDKINAEVFYFVVYENSQKNLDATLQDVKSRLTNIGLKPRQLQTEELGDFLNCFVYKKPLEKGREFELPAIREKKTHILLDGEKWNVASIGKYPVFAEGNSWASSLCTVAGTNVVINFKNANKDTVTKNINKAIKELKYRYLSEKTPSGQQELQIQVEALLTLLQQFSLGNESIHDVNVYVMYKDTEATKVKQAFHSLGFSLDRLILRQQDGFVSMLPFVSNDMLDRYSRNFQGDTLSASFPFVNNLFMDENGDYLGDFRYPVFFDLWERGKNRVNSNLCILGQSGGGKTFCQKKLLMQQRLRGTRVFALDCEHEYNYLANNLGGQIVEMSGGSTINPFQIFVAPNEDVEDRRADGEVTSQCGFLSEWFKTLFDMDIDTKSALDNCIVEMYEKCKITDKTDLTKLKPSDYPTFDTLKELINEKLNSKSIKSYDEQLFRKLSNYISLFVGNGIYARFWNGVTELDISNDFTIFDFQKLFANSNKELCNAQMLLLMRLLMQETIRNKDHNEATGEKTRVIILVDEAHRYISPRFPIALDTLEQFARRIRKYDGALIVATQNIDDFVGTSEEMRSKASAVINNCQYSMLFGLKADDINKVQDLYSNYGGGLTAEEVDFLAKAELGQMLLLAEPERRTIVQVNLMPDEKQYIERV